MKTNLLLALILSLFLASCASDTIQIRGIGVSSTEAFVRTPVEANAPELSFCLSEGSAHVAYGERNRSVKKAEEYLELLPGLVKKNQHFKSLELVRESETSNCDVVLSPYTWIYVTPMQHPEYSVAMGVPYPDDPKKLIFWAYAQKKDSFEDAVGYAANYAYNAFAPGTELYKQFIGLKKNKTSSFEEVAKNYRELKVKPELSEEARKFKVQAESAVKRKEFEIADARYAEALKIAPWWPQGHFNRALILSETERYQSAIDEMNKYLLLVPEAPDARSARDKIYEWEDLAKRKK